MFIRRRINRKFGLKWPRTTLMWIWRSWWSVEKRAHPSFDKLLIYDSLEEYACIPRGLASNIAARAVAAIALGRSFGSADTGFKWARMMRDGWEQDGTTGLHTRDADTIADMSNYRNEHSRIDEQTTQDLWFVSALKTMYWVVVTCIMSCMFFFRLE